MALSAAAKAMAASYGYQITTPKKPVVGPQNVGIVGGGIGGNSNPGSVAGIPLAPPVAVTPAAATTTAPPPPDFDALTKADAGYNTNEADISAQNNLTLASLLKGYMRGSQSAQDNANAHGALFSGAAVNAQRSIGQDYADQQAQQAQNVLSQRHQNYQSVWDRLVQQLAGGS